MKPPQDFQKCGLLFFEQRINAGQVPGLVYETPNSGDVELVEVNRT